MTTETEYAAPVADVEHPQASDSPDVNQATAAETLPEPSSATTEAEPIEGTHSNSDDEQEIEAGASDAAPIEATAATISATSNSLSSVRRPTQEEDRRSELEKQPYDYERCTVQIAIQLLAEDRGAPSAPSAESTPSAPSAPSTESTEGVGSERPAPSGEQTTHDAPSAERITDKASPKGRRVLIGVRTHLDAPIIRMLGAEELGELPPVIVELLEQLKSELPARGQAARDRLEAEREKREKERQARTPKHVRASLAKETKARRAAEATKPKTVQAATAPAPSVLTPEQRANAVDKANAEDKQQLSLF